MLKLKTILVPIDFSERSVKAAEHAGVLADHFDSDLIFVHVTPLTPYADASFGAGYAAGTVVPSEEEVKAEIAKQMEDLAKKVAKEKQIEKVVLKGDTAKEIEKLVQERNVDLVVMPTRGYGVFRRLILGSSTTKILHDVSCPVFTGAHIPEVTPFDFDPYKRVACAVDLSERSRDVLKWAWDFARAYEEDLIVIHAAPALEGGGIYGEWYPVESRQALLEGAKQAVSQLIDEVGCKAEIHVESADPIRYVPRVVEESYADVLVIGRTPKRGVLGRLGAHAYALIRESPCPVISV